MLQCVNGFLALTFQKTVHMVNNDYDGTRVFKAAQRERDANPRFSQAGGSNRHITPMTAEPATATVQWNERKPASSYATERRRYCE